MQRESVRREEKSGGHCCLGKNMGTRIREAAFCVGFSPDCGVPFAAALACQSASLSARRDFFGPTALRDGGNERSRLERMSSLCYNEPITKAAARGAAEAGIWKYSMES